MSRSKVYELNYTETSRLLEAFKEHISSKKHCGSYNLDILLKLQHNKTLLYLQPTEDEIPTCDSNDLPEPLISDDNDYAPRGKSVLSSDEAEEAFATGSVETFNKVPLNEAAIKEQRERLMNKTASLKGKRHI